MGHKTNSSLLSQPAACRRKEKKIQVDAGFKYWTSYVQNLQGVCFFKYQRHQKQKGP